MSFNLKINTKVKDRFIQLFIAGILAIILLLYYKMELSPFPYEDYDIAISSFKKHDAELNEALVLTRFSIIRQYDSIVSSLDSLYKTVAILKKGLEATPNATLSKQLSVVEQYLIKKDNMVTDFKRLNPILINATNDFSNILADIIDAETQADVVERFSIKNYNPEHYEYLNNLNLLFKDVLRYTNTPTSTLYDSSNTLIQTVKKNPLNIERIDLVIKYAETILSYNTNIMEVGRQILMLPLSDQVDKLNAAYEDTHLEYMERINQYQYVFYILSISLLVIVHFAFKRLQNIVQALDESNQKLEQRVQQRTQDLQDKNQALNQALDELHDAQEQLIVKEKMASVGMLTTGIAHEIRNPLNFINNFSEVSTEIASDLTTNIEQQKDKLDADAYSTLHELSADLKENCTRIQEYGKRADNIINSMLMHSKQSGTQKEKVAIHNLLNSAIDLELHNYKTQHPTFNVQIKRVFSPDLTEITAAPAAINQAIIAILSNAFSALNEKVKQTGVASSFIPQLRIQTSTNNGMAILQFYDNGVGIPEENIMKIFEPFFTTQPTGLGHTGLGLSICYDIISKQHKGELSVASKAGEYTEFTIKIPIN